MITVLSERTDAPPGEDLAIAFDLEDLNAQLKADYEFRALVEPIVTLALDWAAVDPDLRRVFHPGSELFARLCEAEAAMLGRPAAEVLAERAAQKPEGPRRYMSYREWSKVRLAEIQHEGVLGSHWPDKPNEGRSR